MQTVTSIISNSQLPSADGFHSRVELPMERNFALWMLVGTICGGIAAAMNFTDHMQLSTTTWAVVSYATVGAISGWLVYGLYDVIANGRMEIDADLPE
ncbi:MAG TPA: hypothetical protein V6C89_11620 [Drouetiella sp.]